MIFQHELFETAVPSEHHCAEEPYLFLLAYLSLNDSKVIMRLQLAAALTAILAGVSFVNAALPARRTASNDPSNEPNHDASNYDEDEYWSTAFSAILSQDPSAQQQQQHRQGINPDDWRRYVRELDDLPDGEFSSLASSSSTTTTAPNNAVGESSTDGANNHRRGRSRFHIDDVPSLSDSAEGRRILQQQAVTLDDLLGPATVNGPPPPPLPGANGADGTDRAEVPAVPASVYGVYKKEDDPAYRWRQGDAETPGYENAADGPGALANKKVTHLSCVCCLLSVSFCFWHTSANAGILSSDTVSFYLSTQTCIHISFFCRSEPPKPLPPRFRISREQNHRMHARVVAHPMFLHPPSSHQCWLPAFPKRKSIIMASTTAAHLAS